jgi:hypothetical protein
MALSKSPEIITAHYENCWGGKSTAKYWKRGPIEELTPGFTVLEFPPTKDRNMWTYATCGMSQQGDAPPVEIHLFVPVQSESLVELLTVIAHYHLTGAYLDVGHTVNFGRPWLAGSTCDHGLISLPYLDGPKLEWLEESDQKIHFLWLVPITLAEVQFKMTHGLEALESRFDSSQFNYLNPKRTSVV